MANYKYKYSTDKKKDKSHRKVVSKFVWVIIRLLAKVVVT